METYVQCEGCVVCRKIRFVLTNRLIKFFQEQARKDKAKYLQFYDDYGLFFREGIVTTPEQEQRVITERRLMTTLKRLIRCSLTSLNSYLCPRILWSCLRWRQITPECDRLMSHSGSLKIWLALKWRPSCESWMETIGRRITCFGVFQCFTSANYVQERHMIMGWRNAWHGIVVCLSNCIRLAVQFTHSIDRSC